MKRHLVILSLGLILSTGIRAQPSFAGAFRGKLPDGSELLLGASNGSMGSVHVLSYTTKSLDLGSFSTATDGAFDAVTPRNVRVSGKFTPTTVTGTYGSQSFTATKIPLYGSSQPIAASYSGFMNDQISRSVSALSFMASNQGEIFMIATRGTQYDAGLGTVDATGSFVIPTVGGDVYSGRLQVVSGVATGNLTVANYGAIPFAVVQTRTGVLQNVSTRGFVGTGDSTMIVGFVVADGSKPVIIRTMGPTLKKFGLSSVLADPSFEIFDASGRSVGKNDDWGSAPEINRIPPASGLTQIDAKDAGLVMTLDPGSYTVVVSGAGGTTGIAIVEVYEVR